jgi:hypothetical protein
MKEVLSLATFALGVLCFVAFVTTVKPSAIGPVQAESKPEHCQLGRSDPQGCGLNVLNVFAAVSGSSTDSDSECRARGSLSAETRRC